MVLAEIILLALALSTDAFAVSISAGTSGFCGTLRSCLRLSWHFGLFQFMMPVIGWFVGSHIAVFIEEVDHWLAFALLSFVGVRMLRAALYPEDVQIKKNPSKGSMLVLLSVATSIDALAVGLSLAFVNISIWQPSVIIGITTAVTSFIGIQIGAKLQRHYGRIAEAIGSIMLLVIGVKIVISHLFS